jgi:hypothetical protein
MAAATDVLVLGICNPTTTVQIGLLFKFSSGGASRARYWYDFGMYLVEVFNYVLLP